MAELDYEQIMEQSLAKYISLANEKMRVEEELAKLAQFMHATTHLLSADVASRFEARWQPYIDRLNVGIASLTDAVRSTLRGCYPKKMTASQIRDQVRVEGFDFSSYKSDPLPSVSTTLRRLKESGEIESEEFEGVAVYQAKPQKVLKRTFRMPYGHTVTAPLGPKEAAFEAFKVAHDRLKEKK